MEVRSSLTQQLYVAKEEISCGQDLRPTLSEQDEELRKLYQVSHNY